MSIPYPTSPVLDQAYTYEGEDTYIWSGTAWEIVLTFPATPTPREAYKYEENEKVYVWTSGTEATNWQPGWNLVSTFPAAPEINQVYTYEGYSYVWNDVSWTLQGYYEPTTNISSRSQDDENRLVNKALTKFPIPYLSGLKLEADVRLEDLVLNTIDEEGVIWICTDIDGWWGFPEPQLPDLVRGWGDGSYDAKGRWNSRIITLKGTFLTQDPSQVPAARAKLIEAANLVYKGGVLVVNEDPAKSAFVRLSGSPDIKTVTARGRTEFSIGLRAADPIKYEYVEVSVNGDGYRTQVLTPSSGSASATLTNLGNIDVPILIELSKGFTVSNPAIPPRITNTETDQAMSIIGGTVSTNRLEIDTYNREVLDVRYDSEQVVEVSSGRSKVSTLSDWIYLAPGENTIAISNFPAGSSCTIYYRSGWIG
jgi:phage-related protein